MSVHAGHKDFDACVNPACPRLVKFITAELVQYLLSTLLKRIQHAEESKLSAVAQK